MTRRFSPKKLMLARKENDLTQADLASRMERSRNTIILWENGKFTPEDKNVEKLAAVLNKPASYFYGHDEEGFEVCEPQAGYGKAGSLYPAKTIASENTITLPLLSGIPETLPEFSNKDIESFAQIPRYLFPGADFIIYRDEEYCVIRKTAEAAAGRTLLIRTEKGFSVGTKKDTGTGAKVIGEVIGIWKRLR